MSALHGKSHAAKPPTQIDLIHAHLKEHGKISPLQALRDFGCMRLADVIYKLRGYGHEIETTWRKQKGKKYAVYVYKGLAASPPESAADGRAESA